jgi:hypothetical protein
MFLKSNHNKLILSYGESRLCHSGLDMILEY